MNEIPPVVSTYLHDYAPKGHLIGYWLGKGREHNVLVLYRRDGEYRLSVGAFPDVVGHWGHDLTGADCGVEEIKRALEGGLWDADEATKERLAALIERIENELSLDEVLAACRAAYDPQGRFAPREPAPRRGPHLTSEGQYRTLSALTKALGDENPANAAESARKLAAMGITEDDGPLFARDALRTFRKRQTRPSAPIPAALAATNFSDRPKRG